MQPYIVLVIILRLIHGLKVFDKIFVISGGGPMRASETLNLMVLLLRQRGALEDGGDGRQGDFLLLVNGVWDLARIWSGSCIINLDSMRIAESSQVGQINIIPTGECVHAGK